MTGHENTPGIGTEGVKESAGEPITYSNSNRYSSIIVISNAAETFIDQLGVDLILGNCELWQLPPSLDQFYTFAWASGRAPLEAEIERLQHECDRLWMWAFNPPAKIDANAKSYAALERSRGNSANADRVEASLAERFAEVTK